MNIKLSIVIANYNAKSHLKRCLPSIYQFQHEVDFEVLVSDSHSTDGSVEMLKELFPKVRILESDTNKGFPAALNKAFKVALGKYILLLDSDTILKPGCLKALAEFLDKNPDAGAAAGRLFSPDGTIQKSAKSFPNPLTGLFGRQTMLGKLFPNNRFSRQYMRLESLYGNDHFEVDWVSAACMIFRRKIIDQTGPIDESYYLYWSDAELCSQIRKYGWSIYYVPGASVIHNEQNDPKKKKNKRMIIAFHKGAYLYYRKHHISSSYSLLNLLAILGLTTRATLHLVLNAFKR